VAEVGGVNVLGEQLRGGVALAEEGADLGEEVDGRALDGELEIVKGGVAGDVLLFPQL
jgi:hypothetical protein